MNKDKFLDILRESLEGEVPQNVIDENLRYYNEYISSASKKEEKQKLEELGQPRLIAKTIIETERAARQTRGTYTDYKSEQDGSGYRDNHSKIFFTNLRWYHYLILAFVILFVLSFLLLIARMLFRLLFVFFIPIIIIIFVLTIIRRN